MTQKQEKTLKIVTIDIGSDGLNACNIPLANILYPLCWKFRLKQRAPPFFGGDKQRAKYVFLPREIKTLLNKVSA